MLAYYLLLYSFHAVGHIAEITDQGHEAGIAIEIGLPTDGATGQEPQVESDLEIKVAITDQLVGTVEIIQGDLTAEVGVGDREVGVRSLTAKSEAGPVQEMVGHQATNWQTQTLKKVITQMK